MCKLHKPQETALRMDDLTKAELKLAGVCKE